MDVANKERPMPINKKIIWVTAFILSIIHIANVWLVFPSHVMRGVHLGFILVLIYLDKGYDVKKKLKSVINIGIMLIGFGSCMYYVFFNEQLSMRMNILNNFDKAAGLLLILVLLDATRRTIGNGMMIVTGCFILYLFIGQYLPGKLGHVPYTLGRIAGHMYVGSNGIFGTLIQMSCTYLALFTLLGAFMDQSGASNAFVNIALKATGRLQGGPALAAVIASMLFGMINGSAVVNVVTTGTFTIPMMKSLGIQKFMAAAAEAAASTGGQLMPPVMGTGAFIMADITGIPYSTIIVKAAIPAFVYFIGVFSGVFFYVKRMNVPAINPSLLPRGKKIVCDLYLLLPMLIVLILILKRFSPPYAALYAIISAVILIIIRGFKNIKTIGENLGLSLINGALNLSSIATGLACAGVITGAVTLSGLGNKLVTFIILVSKGQVFIASVLVAFACLILGMGLPTSAAYVITATMAVPALVEMGLPLFACHLFVFYFAVIAPVTPPVAIAAYAGASIANAPPTKSGIKAFILALPAFLMPFMFLNNPLLLAEGPVLNVLWAGITAV